MMVYVNSSNIHKVKEIIMMKRQKSTLLAVLMLVSLGCSNATAKADNDSFVAGMCAAGAALLGIAGTVALVWCCSETDDQLIARVDAQYRDVLGRYQDDVVYLNRVIKAYGAGSESTLHEFATYVWNKNFTQQDYRSSVWTVKNSLQSSVQTLRKRVNKLQNKCLKGQEFHTFHQMHQLLKHSEELLSNITWLTDVLETYKAYFKLYDAIDVVRSKYFHEISILESERYSTEMEIKRSILNRDNGQYAFRTFVINIKSDISKLESNIHALGHNFVAKRQYAQMLLNYMITIKNIVVNDPRYQQELYEWEQAELQRMRIETERMRAQAEQDRAWAERRKVDAMREQNRIAAERNRIERERLYNERQQCHDNIDVKVNIEFVI